MARSDAFAAAGEYASGTAVTPQGRACGVASRNHSGAGNVVDVEERRPVGLDREDGLHQIRSRIRNGPAERARLRVRQQNRRPDLLEQRHDGIPVQFLLQREVLNRRHLRRVELVEDRIAGHALPGPLRVQLRLRPAVVALGSDKLSLRRLQIERRGGTVEVSLVRGPAPAGLIDHVDRVTLPQEELRPALAAIGRSGEVGSRLRRRRES